MAAEFSASAILQCRRRGDFAGVINIVSDRFNAGLGDAALAIEAGRAALSAGRINDARDWYEQAGQLDLAGAFGVILGLECAQLDVARSLNIGAALRVARKALAEAPSAPEIQYLATRLLLMAATYRELSPVQARDLLRSLRALQREMAAADKLDWAHAVAFWRAERVAERQTLAAWTAVAKLGRREGLAATAGEAELRKAAFLRLRGAPDRDVEARIEAAREAYGEVDHVTGAIDADREASLLAVARHDASLSALYACVDRYLGANYPKGALSLLLDISQLAHLRGERAAALEARRRILDTTAASGYESMRIHDNFSVAELLMRERQDARARDLCDAALAENLPRMLRAGFLALRGGAESFAGNRTRSIADRREAIALYEALDDSATASDVVGALASDIGAPRTETALDDANALLQEWVDKDLARDDPVRAYAKQIQQAEIDVLRILGRRLRAEPADEEPALLARARQQLADVAKAIEQAGANPDFAPLVGARAQTEAQVEAAANNMDGILAAQEKAIAFYEAAGLPFQAASSRYLVGCARLNRANALEGAAFGQEADAAGSLLLQALHYYDDIAGMRLNAAQTRHKLAMLYLNAQHRLVPEAASNACDLAERYLTVAAQDVDDLRRAFSAQARLDSFEAKARRSAEASEVDSEALRLHLLIRRDPQKAWAWALRAKARALGDLVGAGASLPANTGNRIAGNPELLALAQRERDVAKALATAAAADRLRLNEDLQNLYAEMRARPELVDYADLRTGASITPEQLDAVAAQAPAGLAFVDWTAVGDKIFLLVKRPGEAPQVEFLPVSLAHVRAFAGELRSSRRVLMVLRDDPAELDVFAALVAPLSWLTRRAEHLVLCPTGPLHALPLQALPVDGGPLIARNPISWTPSLATLRHACLDLAKADGPPAVFGDPEGDRADARAFASDLAAQLGVIPALGKDATLTAMTTALAHARSIHFSGHAFHESDDPMASHLQLAAGERLDGRKLIEMRDVRCRMVTLGACQSASIDARAGDEPFGLIPALLAGGVQAVTAANWNIPARAAREMMTGYLGRLMKGEPAIEALQKATLDLMKTPEFSTPYHWAPYRLYGYPWGRRI